MTIDASCPNCGTVFTVRRDLIGKRTKCTRCGTPFVISESPDDKPSFGAAPPPDPSGFLNIPDPLASLPPSAPTFQTQAPPRQTARRIFSSETSGVERAQPRPQFFAKRIVAKAYEIMGFIVLGVAVLLLILGLIAIIRNPSAIVATMIGSGITVFWAILTGLLLLFVSQAIRLWLQIEENTRVTSQAVRQLADHLCSIELER